MPKTVPERGFNLPPTAVNDYRPVFFPALLPDRADLLLAIRAFHDAEGDSRLLCVNTRTFETRVLRAGQLAYRRESGAGAPGYFTDAEIQRTPYRRALVHATEAPSPLSNGGLTHAQQPVNGAFLTVDLCPSVAPFERAFFERLLALSSTRQQPLALAVAVSGLWLMAHRQAFAWLQQLRRAERLAITWINHATTHLYLPDLPLAQNFLLHPSQRMGDEVLALERLLLLAGETPSVFFRYPGLVSDEAHMARLAALGLIPVGADAWLAHGELAANGAIVLVHGNGNEPRGIALALEILTCFEWLPLTRALAA
ncbi:hypothetical protein [Paludibacterium sp.]|uniref:hypothetical protein n=1 Tax=Paludibacterium sp. TaxID=1917523 RepID=UPI0025EB300A|nr:hypothetical protein [Paludibacterium sp.]MBV8645898.1 hypothetical protein [Paludibacterium sp.]